MSVIQETLLGCPESGYLLDSCITQLEAQGSSRTCNESIEEIKRGYLFAGVLKRLLARGLARLFQQGLQSMQGSVGTVQRGGEHVRPQ